MADFNLDRFVEAQDPIQARVWDELREGYKRTHWMWFVFPQVSGLGRSDMAERFAIRSLGEAKAYLTHPILGDRLRQATQMVLDLDNTARNIFGSPDDMKFHSSMTLFLRAGGGPLFQAALDKFFKGAHDEKTDEILKGDTKKIGFIGLGAMGSGIALRLLSEGYEVTVWNRSALKMAALGAKGATLAKTPADCLQGDVVFSMLANDAAVRETGLDGAALDGAAKGLIHCNMATVSLALARELTAAHAARGLGYVAAPVFGRPSVAAQGQLLLVAAGAPEAVEVLKPLFGMISRRAEIVGTDPVQANLFKIAGNFLIVSVVESFGEAFALLRKGGADHAQFQEIMASTLFAAPLIQSYGKLMVEETFEPAGFKLALGLKDVNLARAAAAELGVALPLGELMRATLEDAVAAGMGEQDLTAASALIAKKAGL